MLETPPICSSCGRRRRTPAIAAAALGALVLLGVLSSAGQARSAPATKPNFLVIMTDDQTVGELSSMKSTLGLIGRQGVSFDRFLTSFSLCCPSRTTFLTGQYAHNHGVRGNGTPVGGFPAFDAKNSLPVWLQAGGYHTIQIGKFLNGYPTPQNRTLIPAGWDEWMACLDSAENSYFNYTLNQNGTLVRYGAGAADYKTDVYSRLAQQAIQRRADAGPAADPFFMFLAFTAPHLPATPAPRDRNLFAGAHAPRAKSFNEADVSDKPKFIRALPRFTARQIRKIDRNYRNRLQTLQSVDRAVGKVMGELTTDGLLDNTYVLFLSDNGFFFGQHRLAKGKYLPYTASSRTPTLMRGPGIPAGVHSDALVGNVDLAPTILQLSGATATVTEDGQSLMPFATNPGKETDRPMLLEALSRDQPSIGIPFAGIQTDRYKYVRYQDGEEELYDLARDPGELQSRHRDPRYRATKRALAARLAQLRDCTGPACRAPTGAIPGPR